MKYVGTYTSDNDIATKEKVEVKQDKIDVAGILKGTGDGNIESAVPGTDYLAESDLFICTVTASGTNYTCDKTIAEMMTAHSDGKIVVATYGATTYSLYALIQSFARFVAIGGNAVSILTVQPTGTTLIKNSNLQEKSLITDIEANKTSDTTYPSSKAVWNAIPHPDTKTDTQTQTVGVDTNGKLWTNAPSVTSVNNKTGAVSLSASDVGAATTGNIQSYLNRTTAVDESNTSYTSYMARGEALYSYETTPSANGCIAWTYA